MSNYLSCDGNKGDNLERAEVKEKQAQADLPPAGAELAGGLSFCRTAKCCSAVRTTSIGGPATSGSPALSILPNCNAESSRQPH